MPPRALLLLLILGLPACTHRVSFEPDLESEPVAAPEGSSSLPAQVTPAQRETGKLMPEVLSGQFFGMPLKEFEALKPGLAQDKGMDFRTTVTEELDDDQLVEITWYFDNSLPGLPLYEVILEYTSTELAMAQAHLQHGKPNHGEEWLLPTAAGFPVKVWLYEEKLILAAVMPGTEWAP